MKTKVFLGIIPESSQSKFDQIRITKLKVIHAQIPVPKWEKTKKGKTFLGYKTGNQGITNRGRSQGLQIVARGITNRGSFWDFKSKQKEYKSGPRNFESGQRLQIGARGILNQGRGYNLGQDFKSVQNTRTEVSAVFMINVPQGCFYCALLRCLVRNRFVFSAQHNASFIGL